jgi:L-iditol 2-dehydrogenase
MKTRSAYLRAPWQVELRSVELPDTPPAGYALVRIEACGVCGSDLANAAKHATDWKAFGHEIAGVVEAVADPGASVQVGTKVVLESSSFCGHCALCRDGRTDLCAKAPNFWSQPAMGFADRMLAPLACLVPYTGLTPEVASLAEPAGVSYDLVKTADIQLGDRVCILGPGPIGLMAIPLAASRAAGAVTCIGPSHSTRRLEVAQALGATAIALDAALDTRTDLRGNFDRVLVTAPVATIPPALSLLSYGGILTYLGMGVADSRITFDANDFHHRKLQLRASFASPALYFPAVLRLLQTGVIPGQRIISHRFPLAEITEALRIHREDKAHTVKTVVIP